ncbi:MAG: FAD-dependent oxidoreductase [Proteobacteria bacterium]|nr:FAD-dependent oxidoreductase [Burkholderiales bacterium]
MTDSARSDAHAAPLDFELFDLAIIGAGPAGIAAALEARAQRLRTVVLDAQPAPGGSAWRNVEAVTTQRPQDLFVFGPDYADGFPIAQRFRRCGADYRAGASVGAIELAVSAQAAAPQPGVYMPATGALDTGPDIDPATHIERRRTGADRRVHYTDSRGERTLAARHVLIATGAFERAMPLPGWTLPGVLTCGAAHVLLATAGLVPSHPVAIVGSGPLALQVAAQLLRAGVKPVAVVETMPLSNSLGALRHLGAAVLAPGYLAKGLSLSGALRRAGVPRFAGATEVRIEGAARAEVVAFRHRGRTHRLPVATVLLHQGQVPDAQLWQSLKVDRYWDARQWCFRPDVDDWGNTSCAGIVVAGDGAGIGGTEAALCAGELAALSIAWQQRRIDTRERDRRARRAQRALRAHSSMRPFLDRLYLPPPASRVPSDDDTVVCRCEDVCAGELRALVAQGVRSLEQMKAVSRCAMGACGGRLCALTAAELIARATRPA